MGAVHRLNDNGEQSLRYSRSHCENSVSRQSSLILRFYLLNYPNLEKFTHQTIACTPSSPTAYLTILRLAVGLGIHYGL